MTSATPWFAQTGTGADLVLLHPAWTDSTAMRPLAEHLGGYRCLLVDRPGHGRSRDTGTDWSYAQMADSVAVVVEEHASAPVHLVGWSDGAVVGLHLALRRPDLVRSLVFGGAAYHRSGWLDGVLDEEPPPFLRDAYAAVSPDGVEHWPVVVEKSARLHQQEPDLTVDDLRAVRVPTLVVVGDDDQVRWEHLLDMYAALPDGELAVVPRATHGVVVEKPALLAELVREFHREDRGDGLAPIRRAARGTPSG